MKLQLLSSGGQKLKIAHTIFMWSQFHHWQSDVFKRYVPCCPCTTYIKAMYIQCKTTCNLCQARPFRLVDAAGAVIPWWRLLITLGSRNHLPKPQHPFSGSQCQGFPRGPTQSPSISYLSPSGSSVQFDNTGRGKLQSF